MPDFGLSLDCKPLLSAALHTNTLIDIALLRKNSHLSLLLHSQINNCAMWFPCLMVWAVFICAEGGRFHEVELKGNMQNLREVPTLLSFTHAAM